MASKPLSVPSVPVNVPAPLPPDPIAAARALLDQAARAVDPAPFLAAARALLEPAAAPAPNVLPARRAGGA